MYKLTSKTWLIIAVVGFALFILLYNTRWRQASAPTGASTGSSSTTNASAPSPAPAKPYAAKWPPVISIISPAKGDKWVFGAPNRIRWSSQALVPGQIYIVSASTGNIVGWINPQTGINQTYFDWSAKDVAISRTSSLRKDIYVGDYVIKIKFDSKAIPEITSGVFSIVYQSEIKPASYSVSIKNFAATPSSVSLKQGGQVVIANNDPVALVLSVVGRSGLTIQSGQSETFDTANLSPGQYFLYSDQYPSLKLTVNVQ